MKTSFLILILCCGCSTPQKIKGQLVSKHDVTIMINGQPFQSYVLNIKTTNRVIVTKEIFDAVIEGNNISIEGFIEE